MEGNLHWKSKLDADWQPMCLWSLYNFCSIKVYCTEAPCSVVPLLYIHVPQSYRSRKDYLCREGCLSLAIHFLWSPSLGQIWEFLNLWKLTRGQKKRQTWTQEQMKILDLTQKRRENVPVQNPLYKSVNGAQVYVTRCSVLLFSLLFPLVFFLPGSNLCS